MAADFNKASEAGSRLISLSYQMAGVLSQMQEQGDVPDWFKETVRQLLRNHNAAAKARRDALKSTGE